MRELRNRDPEAYRLITIRTTENRLWLPPNSTIRKLTGGIIARYQEKCGIEIYAYCFLGNHFHLLIRAPHGNTDEFCENLNREIARRVNWIHRREGSLWSKRYVDQRVLTDDDLEEAFLYINTNPVHHGLVSDPQQWTGLHSASQVLTETPRTFSFRHYSRPENPITTHKLRLSVLPLYQNMSKKARRKKIQELIQLRTHKISQEKNGKFLGIEKVLRQEPGEKPRKSKRSPKAPFYSKCVKAIREMRKKVNAIREEYSQASLQYRMGVKNVIFPDLTYLPPLHRLPRISHFCPFYTVKQG